MKSDNPYMLSLAAENLSIILCMVHSRDRFVVHRNQFEGEWKSIDKLLFEFPEKRADRALLEMAYLIRSIDDAEDISDSITEKFGDLYKEEEKISDLSLRDVTNKIIHARRYEWNLSDIKSPFIVCYGSNAEKWSRAEIQINKLIYAFGQLHL